MEVIKDPFIDKTLIDYKGDKREEFLKSVYDYCEEVEYDLERTTTKTRRWARLYIQDYLGLSYGERERKFKEIKNKVDKYISEKKHKESGKIDNFNPVLLKKGIKQKKLWENEEQKEEVLKYIYDFCKNVDYNARRMEELETSFGFCAGSAYRYSKMYAIEYLGIPIEEFNEMKSMVRKEQKKPKLYRIFEELLECKDENDMINLLKNSGVHMSVLYDRAYSWAISYRRMNDLKKVRDIINITRQSIQEENIAIKKEERKKKALAQLPIARKMVLDFIGSSEKIPEFCQKNQIDIIEFKKMVAIVKNYDPNLFEQYSNVTNKHKMESFNFGLQRGKSILEQLNKGVVLNDGATREFDVIDYLLTTKLSYSEMLNILKKAGIPEKDLRRFRIFTNRNKIDAEWTKKGIEDLLNAHYIIGVQLDSNNNIIPGSGHEVTKEEKTNIINYIKTQNIPLCNATYQCAFKRYTNGYLTFDEKGKVKQLKP